VSSLSIHLSHQIWSNPMVRTIPYLVLIHSVEQKNILTLAPPPSSGGGSESPISTTASIIRCRPGSWQVEGILSMRRPARALIHAGGGLDYHAGHEWSGKGATSSARTSAGHSRSGGRATLDGSDAGRFCTLTQEQHLQQACTAVCAPACTDGSSSGRQVALGQWAGRGSELRLSPQSHLLLMCPLSFSVENDDRLKPPSGNRAERSCSEARPASRCWLPARVSLF
jgi:hypothetical protein